MKLREIYLEAARRVAEDERNCLVPDRGACWAIAGVSEPGAIKQLHHYIGVREFQDMFCPIGMEAEEYRCWSAWWLESSGESEEETQHCRVMALCFAAEILGEDEL